MLGTVSIKPKTSPFLFQILLLLPFYLLHSPPSLFLLIIWSPFLLTAILPRFLPLPSPSSRLLDLEILTSNNENEIRALFLAATSHIPEHESLRAKVFPLFPLFPFPLI